MASGDADCAMAGSLVSTPPLLTKASVVRTETQTDDRGYEHIVYVTQAHWKVLRDGLDAAEITTEVHRRYKEYYNLYYLLAHIPIAMETAFPRRVLWGSLSEGVVEQRMEMINAWISAVAADPTAALDQIILEWLDLESAQEKAQMVKQGRAPAVSPPSADRPAPAPPSPACPGAKQDSARSAARDRPVDRIQAVVRKLVDEGYDEDDLLPLVEITQDELLLRDLLAAMKNAPPPDIEASVIARASRQEKYSVQIQRLQGDGYTDTDRMAGLLEAFVGDIAMACQAYGSPTVQPRPPQGMDKVEELVAKGYKDRAKIAKLLEICEGDVEQACELYGPK